jgi:hypothetical protein
MRALFTRVLPFPPFGDPGAYFNVHWTYVSKRDGKTYWSGRACRTVDEMLDAVMFANRSPSTKDIYFCLSGQRMAEQKTIGSHTFMAPLRAQQNATQLRALFIDIDVKDGAYPDRGTALQALFAFIKAAQLPRPNAIVSSGSGGFHVYWGLDQALALNDWRPLSQALAEATRQHGLLCDTACTVDGARILRVPGTMNRKREPNTIVTLEVPSLGDQTPLALMRQALIPFMTSNVVALRPGVPLPTGSPNDDLSAGLEKRQARPVVLSSTASECGFIAEALSTGGASFHYPLWHLTTLLAVFAEDGQTMAHDMAKGHPGYDHASTEALYQRKVLDRDARNLGWPSCSTIQNAGCGHCATCPHLAAGKSPLNFGQVAIMPFGAEPDLPKGYMRDDQQRIVGTRIDKDGSTRMDLVIPYPLHSGWLQDHPWTLHFTTQLQVNSAPKSVSLAVSEINGVEMAKRLGAQGMGIARSETTRLQEFFVAWINKLQTMRDKVVSAQPFGWVYTKGNPSGFAYAGVVYSKGSAQASASPDAELLRQYSPHGDLAKWLEASETITVQKRPALDAILASAFAGPLIKFTGQNGSLLSAYSRESGAGKTTALRTATAVWGHPVASGQVLTDTPNSVAQKMNNLRALPVYWDELRTEGDNQKFMNFIMRNSQGKNSSRLAPDASQREVGIWETMVIVASNVNLIDYAQRASKNTVAGVYRIFEFPVQKLPPSMSVTKVSQIVADLNEHHGTAGQVYAKYLGENGPKVRDFVRKTQAALETKLLKDQQERMWLATATALVCGATIANKLQLTKIDVPAMLEFIERTMITLRGTATGGSNDLSSDAALLALMGKYMRFVQPRGFLRTNVMVPPGVIGRPATSVIKVTGDITRLDNAVVHYSDEGCMLFPAAHFCDWLAENGWGPHMVVDALKLKWSLKELPKATPGLGTPYAVFLKEKCYFIDLKAAGVMDDLAPPPVTQGVNP